MAIRGPQEDYPTEADELFLDHGVAGIMVFADFFPSAPPVPDPLYIGAAGRTSVHLGALAPSQVYLGVKTLFP